MWHISLTFLLWLKWLKHQNVNEALISQVILINKHFTTFYDSDKMTRLLKQLLTTPELQMNLLPFKRNLKLKICEILLFQKRWKFPE